MFSRDLKLQETSAFMVEWLRAPLVTASVIPSSDSLACKMVQAVAEDSRCVVELGPGTGAFTRQLLSKGVKEEALVLVELNRRFAHKLRDSYPNAKVIIGAAESLSRQNLQQADVVISGLPLLSIRDHHVDGILQGVFDVMRPGGILVQFTYGFKCPVKETLLKKHGLEAKRVHFVVNNFPPASVYHISKRAAVF